MPEPPARADIQRDEAVGEQVVPAMAHAQEVWLRRSCGDEGDAALLIHGHATPAIRPALRPVPRLVTKFTGVRHRMKGPPQFARHGVQAPHILLKPRHHDGALEDGWPRRGRPRQRHPAPRAEAGHRLAAHRVQRVEKLAGAEEQPLARAGPPRPPQQPAKGGPAFRLEPPFFHARRGIHGDDLLAHRRRKHHAAHDDGVALNVRRAVLRVIRPRGLEVLHVAPVELRQRGETGGTAIAVRAGPGAERLGFREPIVGREFVRAGGGNGLVKRQFRASGGVFHRPIIHLRAGGGGLVPRGWQRVEVPQTDRALILLQRFRRHGCDVPRPTGNPHVVHQAIATQTAFHQSAKGQSAGPRRAGERAERRLAGQLPVHKQPHAGGLNHRRQRMPLAVGNVHLRFEFPAPSWQVKTEHAAADVAV